MPNSTPQHIAIIMDGNRRWAKKHGLEIIQGHQKVAREVIERLADHCILREVKYLTLWAFSTENWNRNTQEVIGLMQLFREAFETNAKRLHQKGIRVGVIGCMSKFSVDIQENVKHWLNITKKNQKLTVTFAMNYGGRDELIRACENLVNNLLTDEKKLKRVKEAISNKQSWLTELDFIGCLDSKHLPDPDMIIRPGGEQRMSGFLPWQGTYAEYYFTDVLMPDFNEHELDKALEEFANRQRRFGK